MTIDPKTGQSFPEFKETLAVHGLQLVRVQTRVCQVNLGLVCNQACKHCHLSAGPDRTEMMTRETMDEVLSFLERSRIPLLDITGGAPELNPFLPYLMERAGESGVSLMLRCNLSALFQASTDILASLLVRYRVNVVASLPSLNPAQTESQRGKGIFDISLGALKMLNRLGYGDPDTGLLLDLVSNPSGAFMPASQEATEKRFSTLLKDRWGIRFNRLFTFANMPLGRFGAWLERSGNYERYLTQLYKGFNPCTVDGLMCRDLISVAWDGRVYDCDFNQAAAILLGEKPIHIRALDAVDLPGTRINVGDHCYACTAGAGFT